MIKKVFVPLLISIFFLINTSVVSAVSADTKGAGEICSPALDRCSSPNYSCLQYDSSTYLCLSRVLGAGEKCDSSNIGTKCIPGYDCQFDNTSQTDLCLKSTAVSFFGRIQPPDALKNFLGTDKTGAGAISKFLSNGIILIYSLATIVLIFMLLWGAFQWMTSGGDKEAIAKARGRIISAIIGIILFAVAFAVIQILGRFTGFTFFVGQRL